MAEASRVLAGADSSVWVSEGTLHVRLPTPHTAVEDLAQRTQRRILHFSGKFGKAVIDLRGNVGGSLPVFISALYPLLPECYIEGIGAQGQPFALITEYRGRLVSRAVIPPPARNEGVASTPKKVVLFDEPLLICAKPKLDKVTVRVDARSMSSSQVIAEMVRAAGGQVDGEAPEDYLHGTTTLRMLAGVAGDSASIPTYRLRFTRGPLGQQSKMFVGLPAALQPYTYSVIAKTNLADYSDDFISDQHMHAVMRDEYMGGNGHAFVHYARHRSAVREYVVDGKPTMFAYFGHVMGERYHVLSIDELVDIYEAHLPTWRRLYEFAGPIVVDLRGMKQDGRGLVMVMSPFIKTTAFAIHQSGVNRADMLASDVDASKLARMDMPVRVYLSNRGIDTPMVEAGSVGNPLADRDVTFLVDRHTGKTQDLHSAMFLHYISREFTVYGAWPANPDVAWIPSGQQEVVAHPVMISPSIRAIEPIPAKYRPYKK